MDLKHRNIYEYISQRLSVDLIVDATGRYCYQAYPILVCKIILAV
jgi:hypothetical protein